MALPQLAQGLCTCCSLCLEHASSTSLLILFVHSLPSGFLLNVTLSREAILYEIAIPWHQPLLPFLLLCRFHHHPIRYALTCPLLLVSLYWTVHFARPGLCSLLYPQILEQDLSCRAKGSFSEPCKTE